MRKTIVIDGRETLIHVIGDTPEVLLVQTMGKQEEDGIEDEVELIREQVGDTGFVMAAFLVDDWERELTPWHDDVVSKRDEVGEHANDTLLYLTERLVPFLYDQYGLLPVILGGYSLGGLFSRWATSQSDMFEAVACVSPSLWIAGWRQNSMEYQVKTRNVYLSLGDREECCKNKSISQVGDNVRWEHDCLTRLLGTDHTILEWNQGNHFTDVVKRTARGFVWCVNKVLKYD